MTNDKFTILVGRASTCFDVPAGLESGIPTRFHITYYIFILLARHPDKRGERKRERERGKREDMVEREGERERKITGCILSRYGTYSHYSAIK